MKVVHLNPFTNVSTDGISSQMETAGCYIDTNFQLEQPASTSVSAQSVLSVTSDLCVCVGGGGSVAHHHFAQVEPDVAAPPEWRNKAQFKEHF